MRTHNVRFSTLVICALLLSARMSLAQSSNATAAGATAPRTLSYQGVLAATESGIKATGTRLLTVTLYSDANGTMKLWQSTMNTQVDSNGVFNCLLGTAENPLPAPQTMDRPIWLGVAVDNGPELRPLSQVTASAYALNVVDLSISTDKVIDNAITTSKLADNAVTTAKISDSSITASKVNMDYISSININGVQFTGHGTPLNIQGENGITAAYKADSNTLVLYGSENNLSAPKANGDGGSDWSETGNKLTTPNTNYVGTSDNEALWIKADDSTVMRYVPTTGQPNIIGGNVANTITGNGSVIGGGGLNAKPNNMTANFGFIGGGSNNTVDADSSVLVGGIGNEILQSYSTQSFLGGGANNKSSSMASFLGGGIGNQIGDITAEPNNDDTGIAIVGGEANYINEGWCFIGGGGTNRDTNCIYASIVGGQGNYDLANYSFIGGGVGNIVGGQKGAITGGNNNTIGGGVATSTASFIGAGSKNLISSSDSGHGVIGGGSYNTLNGGFQFIGGGNSNAAAQRFGSVVGGLANADSGWAGIIGGGEYNSISNFADIGVINGGLSNRIDSGALYSAIGGGRKNLNQGSSSVIAGGDTNVIERSADHSFIGGGLRNSILNNWDGAMIDARYSVLGGGRADSIFDSLDVLVGGDSNKVLAPWAFLGGGAHNFSGDRGVFGVEDSFAVVVGGLSNWSREEYSAIVGGQSNQVMGSHGFIGGGALNLIDEEDSLFTQYSTIAGGYYNWERSFYDAIGGGDSNLIQIGSAYALLGGGLENTVDTNSPYAALAGGGQNYIYNGYASFVGAGADDTVLSLESVLVGGQANKINTGSIVSFMGGGAWNLIDTSAPFSVIGGGCNHRIFGDSNGVIAGGCGDTVNAYTGFIGAGVHNAVHGSWSAIAGGSNNVINQLDGFIGGGIINSINDNLGTIGGGRRNQISSGGFMSTIPGGDSLTAQSYAQTVMGYNNVPQGSFIKGTHHTKQDQPLLILGNGDDAKHQSDAATISYDGHISAYDTNGTGGGSTPRASFVGTLYEDNNIYAWADVPMGTVGSSVTPTADFGVSLITHPAVGEYDVTLNIKNPDGSAHAMSGAAIVVTVEAPSKSNCYFATCTPIGTGNAFKVFIHDNQCGDQNSPFMFHVCGR